MSDSSPKCGYYPPASRKALRRARVAWGHPGFRDPKSKPCGKPATHVAIAEEFEILEKRSPLYLCSQHAKHNGGRGYQSRRIGATK